MENSRTYEQKDKLILERSRNLKMPDIKNIDVSWEEMKSRIDSRQNIRPIATPKQKLIRISAAAAALFAIATTFAIYLSGAEYSTAYGQTANITLPDNSEIQLNSGSQLSYNSLLWHFNRNVTLEGEAFFVVEKGSTFKVETLLGEVEVLGTRFNVNTFGNELSVFCESGKVAVSNNINSSEIGPGQSCIIRDGALSSKTVNNPGIYTGWINGEFQFIETPINEVLKSLERQYDVEIEANFGGDELFTGAFGNKNLPAALELICAPYGKTFVIKEHSIVEIK